MNTATLNLYKMTIANASAAAYQEDAFFVVGKRRSDNSGNWAYFHSEDPESDFLDDSVLVGGDGVQPDYEAQHQENLKNEAAL